MSTELKSHLTNGQTWFRGLLILLFGALYGVAEFVAGVVVLLQFGSHLVTGAPNARLLELARGLNAYLYQILQFVTYRSELRPFPLGQWPTRGLEDVAVADVATGTRPVETPDGAAPPAVPTSRADEEPREF